MPLGCRKGRNCCILFSSRKGGYLSQCLIVMITKFSSSLLCNIFLNLFLCFRTPHAHQIIHKPLLSLCIFAVKALVNVTFLSAPGPVAGFRVVRRFLPYLQISHRNKRSLCTVFLPKKNNSASITWGLSAPCFRMRKQKCYHSSSTLGSNAGRNMRFSRITYREFWTMLSASILFYPHIYSRMCCLVHFPPEPQPSHFCPEARERRDCSLAVFHLTQWDTGAESHLETNGGCCRGHTNQVCA